MHSPTSGKVDQLDPHLEAATFLVAGRDLENNPAAIGKEDGKAIKSGKTRGNREDEETDKERN